ncbi:MAG: hypothetical protein EOS65_03910 [Mesorhizobium sp.]|nr:hypothetical protein EN779_14625 [Mesorhizobium sp. M4B.F.Ca.ET.088.02.2.1]RWF32444.1 MAG: hypothetical protein EOS45_06930 [Mesorhizobium sp.]RWF43964.1 MAG: hypothetical protein EOS65_03910 [Mesorhizobium sp.]TIX18494.1 MAG: hypothetical protein E5V41_05840 [Mesorhizobium sp.]TJW08541.1 MAG: hypothetical protein E5W97_04785 [Mesorhizobium sp.]
MPKQDHHASRAGIAGVELMEFAVCYDNSGTVLASSIFLCATAVFVIAAAFVAGRLISMRARVPSAALTAW